MKADIPPRIVMLMLALAEMEMNGLVKWTRNADGGIRFSLTEEGRKRDPHMLVDGHTFTPEALSEQVMDALTDKTQAKLEGSEDAGSSFVGDFAPAALGSVSDELRQMFERSIERGELKRR